MIQPGSKLAHYEIVSALGKGGMGEVWRARDTKLGREVAIKVLPLEFAQDPERLARLEREARMLAALNHPNIAAIHGFEESDGTRFLVLELVEGDTLADRLKRGAISVEESLKLALQIAEALEAAHEKGVIHRDLKPANIKITPEGRVKVLDFGLAKAFEGATGDSNLSNSPTLSMQATQQGVILGTAAYMSPEQASGQTTDKRTDIWSFGAVLFEMVTGRPAFAGETVSHILAGVLRAEPEWAGLPVNLHPRIRLLLERCLDKSVQNRAHDIADARVDIEKVMGDPEGALAGTPGLISGLSRRTVLGWTAGAVGAAGLGVLVGWRLSPPGIQTAAGADETTPTRSWLQLDADGIVDAGFYPSFSPDGNRLVFVSRDDDGVSRVYVHRIDEATTTLLPGTEGGEMPYFSPDGRSIAFSVVSPQGAATRKIDADGTGTVVELAANQPFGELLGSWDEDGNIIVGGRVGPLFRFRDTGGEGPGSPVTETAPGEVAHRFPQLLPGGEALLFSVAEQSTGAPPHLEVVFLGNRERKRILDGAAFGRFLSSGHLVYMRDGDLYARVFDLDAMEAGEDEVRVLEAVQVEPGGEAHAAFSANGRVAYRNQPSLPGTGTLELALDGSRTGPLPGVEPGLYEVPRFSPDGTRLAFVRRVSGRGELSVYEFDRQSISPLGGRLNRSAFTWSGDGRFIFYSSEDGITWIPTDRIAEPRLLLDDSAFAAPPAPIAISPDGTELAGTGSNPEVGTGVQVWIVGLDTSGSEPRVTGEVEWFTQGPGNQVDPTFSRDGGWIAFTNGLRTAVRPRRGQGTWDAGPGSSPLFSRTQDRLYLRSGPRVVSVDYSVEGDRWVRGPGEAVPRSEPGLVDIGISSAYDVDPRGDRLAVVMAEELQPTTDLVFLTGFFGTLDRLVG